MSNKHNSQFTIHSSLIFLLLLLQSVVGVAQVEGSLSVGWALPNDKKWDYISSPTVEVGVAKVWPLRLDASLRNHDKYEWGLRADYLLAREAIAGHRFACFGFVNSPIAVGKSYRLSWSLEAGLSFYTQPYKITFDDLNEFIGSYTNCHIGIGLRNGFVLPHRDQLVLSLFLRHSSNGYLKKPNQGLNYLQAELAYRFAPTESEDRQLVEDRNRPCAFFVSLAPGMVLQRGGGSNTRYFFTYTLQGGGLYRFDLKRGVGASLDLMYNGAHNGFAEQEGVEPPFPMYVGAAAVYETAWNSLFMRFSFGGYLVKSPYVTMPIYERLGAYYRFGQRLHQYLGVGFKAHYAHVDYIEWTYGIEF